MKRRKRHGSQRIRGLAPGPVLLLLGALGCSSDSEQAISGAPLPNSPAIGVPSVTASATAPSVPTMSGQPSGDTTPSAEATGAMPSPPPAVTSTSPVPSAEPTNTTPTTSAPPDEPPDEPPTGDPYPVQPSAGCGQEATGGRHTADGSYGYKLTLPMSYDPGRPYAVVFGMHGSEGRYGTVQALGEDGIYVFPDYVEQAWGVGHEKNIVIFEPIINDISAKFCIDKNAIFAIGSSQGGRISGVIGCKLGHLFRGVAPINPGPAGGTMGDVGADDCMGNSLYFGISTTGDKARKAVTDWYIDIMRERNGCTEQTEAMDFGPCEKYQGCKDGNDVILCQPPGPHGTFWKLDGGKSAPIVYFRNLLNGML